MRDRDLITQVEFKIDLLRKRMITTAQLKGLKHPDTIKCSQELDIFLNKYQQIKTKSC